MALDQALLDQAEATGEGFVRLYGWLPWCLSFGRHEPALRRYDRVRIRALGLDTVRRPTGGRAVWHARELTYAVAAPMAWFGGLTRAYRAIHAAIAAALEPLGISPTLAPSSPPTAPGAGACFASPAGGEVLVDGRKLVGSAQLSQGQAFLQHGSLLLEDDQRLVSELALANPSLGREITLREALGRTVSRQVLSQAVATEFARWGGHWRNGLSQSEIDTLAETHAARFRDPAWTWRR